MFGQQDDNQGQAATDDMAIPDQVVNDPVDTTSPAQPADDQAWQHPGAPLYEVAQPAVVTPSEPVADASDTAPVVKSAGGSASANELLDIKQQALTQLSPLVGHLDQSPEDKFRTTMMMIQASDDQSLIKTAFEAAQAIEDEKTRAQALLDIVNEINYFTQHTPQP